MVRMPGSTPDSLHKIGFFIFSKKGRTSITQVFLKFIWGAVDRILFVRRDAWCSRILFGIDGACCTKTADTCFGMIG